MLIKEFLLGWPHPSTVHAEKCKLNVVLYVMRDAGSVTQSLQLPECFLLLSWRHCEASVCFWLQRCWLSPTGSNKARSVNKRVYRKTQACTGTVYRPALLKIDWVQTWLPFSSISFATKREHLFTPAGHPPLRIRHYMIQGARKRG